MSPNDAMDEVCTVESALEAGVTRITVRGELDAMSAPDLHAALGASDEGDVELDLAGVTFIDSSGLAAVIESYMRLRPAGRRLVIVGRSPVVQRLLDLSGVSTQLDLDP